MQRTILLYRVILGMVLLAPPAAWGQSAAGAPAPLLLDAVPPATAPPPAMETAFPDFSQHVPDEPKDRPAAAAQPADTVNATGALGAGGPFGGFDPRTLAIFQTSFATTWYPSERV